MNFRSTILAFGLLLGMLWLFGLMLALHTGTLEKDLVLPTFHAAKDAEIDQVTIERQEGGADEKFVFTRKEDDWHMRVPPVKRSTVAIANKVQDIINGLRDARQNREATLKNDPAHYGLDKPVATITLRGKDRADAPTREWKIFVGKKSADDKGFIYVNSSDRPGQILAVPQSSLTSAFFQQFDMRPKTLLDTAETSVQWFRVASGKEAIELKKGEGTTWQFVTPKLGFAEWQSPDAKKLGPVDVAPDGVRALASALGALRVEKNDDFVPLNDDDLDRFGLAPGSERLRIDVSNDAKDHKNKQTLLVGNKAPSPLPLSPKERGVDAARFYARLGDDEALVTVDGAKLEPLFKALKNPESLRSREIVHLDGKKIDAISLRIGTDAAIEFKLGEADQWKIVAGGETRKASGSAVKDLLEALKKERLISEFIDVTGPEAKKKDAELGLDPPAAQIKLWSTSPKEKDDARDNVKAGAGPDIEIEFGNVKNDLVYGKSTTSDGLVTRFAAPKSLFEAVAPKNGVLAFFDAGVPAFDTAKAIAVTRLTADQKTEIVSDKDRWQLLNATDLSGKNFADSKNVTKLLQTLEGLETLQWLSKVDAKTDLANYGLKPPALELIVRLENAESKSARWASFATAALQGRPFLAIAQMLGGDQPVVYKFGRKGDDYYGLRSGSDLLFRVDGEYVRSLSELDLRDRFWLAHLEPALDASTIAAACGANVLLNASPLVTHQVAQIDPAQITELRVAVRTPAELRRFAFVRKNETVWQDKTGLEEFDVDSSHINELLAKLSDLRAQSFVRLQGGPLPEHKLAPKAATIHLELAGANGKTIFALAVGAAAGKDGYYAATSLWPEAVFVLPATDIEPLLRGAAHFGKTRVAE